MWLVTLALAATPPGWEELGTSDGVTVARKTIEGSPLFAFRGEATLDVHAGVLAGVLLSDGLGPEWVDLMVLSKLVADEGGGHRIVHQGYDLPWPLADRDYIMRQTLVFDAASEVFTLEFQSIEDPRWPVDADWIRAYAHRTYWRITALDDGRSLAEVEVHTDPKGALPAWLVNAIQKDWPRATLTALEDRAQQGDVARRAEMTDW